MKAIFLIAAAIAISSAPVQADKKTELAGYQISYEGDSDKITELTGAVVEAAGSPAEIIGRAQFCASRFLSTGGASQGTALEILGGNFKSVAKDATALIELVDKENGLLVANTAAAYTSGILSNTARAKLTLQAKEGRFRIIQSDLATAQANGNSNSRPIVAVWGTGWEPAAKALIDKADKLTDCIVKPAVEEW